MSLLLLRKLASDKLYVSIRYFVTFKRFLKLKNPKTFNEKINWLKLYYRNPDLPSLVDKYKVRGFVEQRIGDKYLNKNYGVYGSAEEINWQELPDSFVLKPTHGSGWVIICRNKNELNIEGAKAEMNFWLTQNFYKLWGEWVYKHVQPKIICERYLEEDENDGLKDYKFYCFDGQPKFVHVDVNRFNNDHYINFYSLEWNKLPVRKGVPNSEINDPKPKQFKEMLAVARKLSAGFPFVRVDLFEVQSKIYFGELTFFPQNGLSSFYPKSYEREFGNYIALPDMQTKKDVRIIHRKRNYNYIYRLRQSLSKYSLFEKIIVTLKKRKGDFQDATYWQYIDTADKVVLENTNKKKLPTVGLVKDLDNYGVYVQKRSHWPKYERFLKNNNIPYSFFEIHNADWAEQAKKYDLIIYRPDISPSRMHEAESKLYFIEKHLNITCFPSYEEIWSYEDKVRSNYLLEKYKIPHVPTFTSNSKADTLKYIDCCTFPLISKISCGSVSRGVEMIKTKKQAEKLINKIFSGGRKTYWSDYKQKDYVYFQEFIEDAKFDLRIVIIGEKVFGYYRFAPKNDFRASGAGIYKYIVPELPVEAMKTALITKQAFGSTVLAVDMIKSERSGQYLVIESSVFFDIDDPDELVIDNVTGYYEWSMKNGAYLFEFKPGRFWMQELILKELIITYQNKHLSGRP